MVRFLYIFNFVFTSEIGIFLTQNLVKWLYSRDQISASMPIVSMLCCSIDNQNNFHMPNKASLHFKETCGYQFCYRYSNERNYVFPRFADL